MSVGLVFADDFQGVEEDIRTLQQNLSCVKDISRNLLENADPAYHSALTQEVQEICEQWQDVTAMAARHQDKLREVLGHTRKFLTWMSDMEAWIDWTRQEKLGHDVTISDQTQLDEAHQKFKVKITFLFRTQV